MNFTAKIYFKLLLMAAAIFATASCKKLIEVPTTPSDRITDEQAFSDSSNIMNVMAGIYTGFGVVDYRYPIIHNGGTTIFTGLSSDELVNVESVNSEVEPFFTNSLLPNSAFVTTLWGDTYSSIYGINAAFEGIEGSNAISPQLASQLYGELKTIRALYYFNLVNLFGGVPLIVGTDYKTNARLPRLPEKEIYEWIMSELEESRQLLVPEYPSEGRARPNRYTATALLAKVYLYRENWQKAAELSDEIIDAGLYTLEPELNNIFLSGSPEAIWQLPGRGMTTQTEEGVEFIPSAEPGSIPKYQVTQSLLNAFEPDDQRKVKWVAEYTNDDLNVTYTIPYKYKNNVADAATTEDYMIFRLSEQYLIRAEALAQLDKSDEALAALNLVRNRAGLEDLSFADKETLLLDIMHERQIELFCEWGNRWFDLKRTHTADAVLGSAKLGWQPNDALFPVPLEEIKTNPFLVQNPGY